MLAKISYLAEKQCLEKHYTEPRYQFGQTENIGAL